jgi:hypothetical protein
MKSTLKKVKTKSWVINGDTLTEEEFKAGVKSAEKGPFYTIEAAKKLITKWRSEKNSR